MATDDVHTDRSSNDSSEFLFLFPIMTRVSGEFQEHRGGRKMGEKKYLIAPIGLRSAISTGPNIQIEY